MNADSYSTITLRASRSWIGWWIGTTVFMIFIIIFSLSTEILNYIWAIYMAIFFFFVGLVRTSKQNNLKITQSFIEVGLFFRKKTSWDQISRVYSDLDYLYWEEITRDQKVKTHKVPYEHWGRECVQNGKKVSKELALEWIQKLRESKSVRERIELISEFVTIRTIRKKRFQNYLRKNKKKQKHYCKNTKMPVVSIEWKEGMKFDNILNKKAGCFLNQKFLKEKKSWDIFLSF